MSAAEITWVASILLALIIGGIVGWCIGDAGCREEAVRLGLAHYRHFPNGTPKFCWGADKRLDS